MKAFITVLACTLGLAALALAPVPIPPDRPLDEHLPPDGGFVVRTSWRPAGLLGAMTGDNPWVYLTLVEQSSGETIVRYRAWGDVPEDVYGRIVDHEPFSGPEYPPWEGVELVLTTCANSIRGLPPEFAESFHAFHGGGSDWTCFEPQFHAYIERIRQLCSDSLPPSAAQLEAALRPLIERCMMERG